jgi:hypothetical protein
MSGGRRRSGLDWDAALDAFDTQVQRQELAFRRGLPAPPDLELEPPTTAMTELQQLRAAGIVARSEELADDIVALLAARSRTARSAYA